MIMYFMGFCSNKWRCQYYTVIAYCIPRYVPVHCCDAYFQVVSLEKSSMQCQDDAEWNAESHGNDVMMSDQALRRRKLGCSFSVNSSYSSISRYVLCIVLQCVCFSVEFHKTYLHGVVFASCASCGLLCRYSARVLQDWTVSILDERGTKFCNGVRLGVKHIVTSSKCWKKNNRKEVNSDAIDYSLF